VTLCTLALARPTYEIRRSRKPPLEASDTSSRQPAGFNRPRSRATRRWIRKPFATERTRRSILGHGSGLIPEDRDPKVRFDPRARNLCPEGHLTRSPEKGSYEPDLPRETRPRDPGLGPSRSHERPRPRPRNRLPASPKTRARPIPRRIGVNPETAKTRRTLPPSPASRRPEGGEELRGRSRAPLRTTRRTEPSSDEPSSDPTGLPPRFTTAGQPPKKSDRRDVDPLEGPPVRESSSRSLLINPVRLAPRRALAGSR
jgi:hypothetical protein